MEDNKGSVVNDFTRLSWINVNGVWENILFSSIACNFVEVSGDYGHTNLKSINIIGEREFCSSDPRYKRKTFAMRVGYDGSKYNGYQKQKGVDGVRTVEDDIETVLQRKVVAAGRTDKDVSASSQIVSFSTYDDIDECVIASKFANSDCFANKRLILLDCQRVPKKFHALFSATWRRYLYIVPQCSSAFVDTIFINECLQQLEHKVLPYNAFAFREKRDTGEGNSDLCTLMKAKAYPVYKYQRHDNDTEGSDVVYYSKDNDDSNKSNLIQLLQEFVCIELVGDRFLRRMVRNIVGTVVTEALLPPKERNVNILEDICKSGDRKRVLHTAPGIGLALCGVGYSLEDLQLYKHPPSSASTAVVSTTTLSATINNNDNNNLAGKIKQKKQQKLIYQQNCEAFNNSKANNGDNNNNTSINNNDSNSDIVLSGYARKRQKQKIKQQQQKQEEQISQQSTEEQQQQQLLQEES